MVYPSEALRGLYILQCVVLFHVENRKAAFIMILRYFMKCVRGRLHSSFHLKLLVLLKAVV